MRECGLSLAIVAVVVLPSYGAPGDQWILGIHHIDDGAEFTTYTGGGYSGPRSSGPAQYSGNSYGYASTGPVGVNRIYWELSGNSINNNTSVPATAELYKVEFYGTTEPGHNSWQPVESQFRGVAGENYPIDTSIPWAGDSGTNHQYIAADGFNDGAWHVLGPGPHGPNSPSHTAGPTGNNMWLKAGSWLYAKWDFNFGIDRSWSALRLTQITPIAPPPITGDYNANGVVDGADYVLWRNGDPRADGFDDDIIDEFDYFIWRENFGHTSGSGSAADNLASTGAVPEPATFSMLAVMGMLCFVAPRPLRR